MKPLITALNISSNAFCEIAAVRSKVPVRVLVRVVLVMGGPPPPPLGSLQSVGGMLRFSFRWSRFMKALSWSCSMAGLFGTLVAADTCSSPMPSGMLIRPKARFEIELAKGGIIPWFRASMA